MMIAQILVLELLEPEGAHLPALSDLRYPVAAYLNGLAPSSRRPQLAALEAIARRSTQIYSAETMPWQQLRRPHVLKIRSLLEENYRPASANRMLAALRGVLKECRHAGLISSDDYQAAADRSNPAGPGPLLAAWADQALSSGRDSYRTLKPDG